MEKQHTTTVIVDDFDGDSAAETSTFSFLGTDYQIDLNENNTLMLKEVLTDYDNVVARLTEFVTKARPIPEQANGTPEATEVAEAPKPPKRRRSRKTAATSSTSPTDTEIRQWANERGIEVNMKGRVNKTVREAYHVEHQ